MSKLIYFLSFAVQIMISGNCFSQQVIAAAGANTTGTNVQLSWTIGEPVIETFTGNNVILTQGFHQSKLTVTAIDPIALPTLKIKVYPNPFVNQLHVDVTR